MAKRAGLLQGIVPFLLLALIWSISEARADVKVGPKPCPKCVVFTRVPTSKKVLVRHLFEKDWHKIMEYFHSGILKLDRDIFYAAVDLDDDGEKEILLLNENTYFCGTAGCALDIWKHYADGWQKICGTALQNKYDLMVSSKKAAGFHELVFAGIPHPHNWKVTTWLPDLNREQNLCDDDSDEKG